VSEAHLYVYGVVPGDAKAPDGTGIDGGALRVIPGGDVAALVSEVPPEELDPTRERLTTHMDVLKRAHDATRVLPMRFGVVMPGEDAVRADLLEAYAPRLTELLTAIAKRGELEVRATYREEAVMRAVLERHPEIRQARESLAGKPDDATYYERIQLGEQVAAAITEVRDEQRNAMLDALSPLAVETRASEPAHELDALSAAFLVDEDKLDAFDAAVNDLDRRFGDLVRLKYFGPLPPHSFVDLEGEVPAWA
jgi:Gas vesicle synthesis protein GvpL/GvpF